MLREIKGGSSAHKLWVRILTSFLQALLHTASAWGFFLCLHFVIYNTHVSTSGNFFPVSVRFCSAARKTNEKPLSREKFLMSLYTGTLHSPWKAEENINYIGSKFHTLFPVFPQHSSQCTQGSFWSETRFRWASAFHLLLSCETQNVNTTYSISISFLMEDFQRYHTLTSNTAHKFSLEMVWK